MKGGVELISFMRYWKLADFNVLVLGAGSWPLNPPTTSFNIPDDVSSLHCD